MNIQFIGKYLERRIWIAYENINELNDSTLLIESSILFINISTNWNEEQLEEYFNTIAEYEPIAFCVSGKNSDIQFDLILNALGKMNSKKHTMTFHFKSKKVEHLLTEYFSVVFPDGERWDEWKNYGIIVHDFVNQKNAKSVIDLIKKQWSSATLEDGLEKKIKIS